jgi:hypothetical protein
VRGARVATALLCAASSASAAPQLNASVYTGAAGRSTAPSVWSDTAWFSGVRGDALFLRERVRDMALGPYVDVSTAAFSDLRLGGGASWLLPITEDVPIILSFGALGRLDEGRWQPGWSTQLFVGSRSYNFSSRYALGGGLLLAWQESLNEPRDRALVVAAQIDLQLLLLPALLAIEAIRGPRDSE